MNYINTVVTRYGKKRVITSSVIISLLVIGIVYTVLNGGAPVVEEETKTTPEVTTKSVRSMAAGATFTAVGTVTAVSEAKLQAEAGGRITAVNVALGDTVGAGTILARLEGAAEAATLLQAQGAYEAALAGAAQGNVGVNEAKNGLTAAQNAAVTTYKSAYGTVSGVLFGTIDQFFANPDSPIPGVRLSSAYTPTLNADRVSLQTSLPAWQSKSVGLNVNNDLEAALSEAETITKKVVSMTDAFIAILSTEKPNDKYTDTELRTLTATYTGIRGQLVGTLSGIDAARTGLSAARDGVKRAEIAGSGNQVSSADAQVKIALGSLRAAQANYERTIVRTPISGVVNALYLKAGEYAAPGSPAAIVANKNNGLEISTSVSQEDSVKLAVGDVVNIDDIATGTIAAIAGAIDPTTGKVALKVNADENSKLQNGSTVSVSFATAAKVEVSDITIPLSAIKMTGSGPVVFKIGDESKLQAIPVVLGAITGEQVVVTEGVTFESVIVVDARGLKEGTVVTVK